MHRLLRSVYKYVELRHTARLVHLRLSFYISSIYILIYIQENTHTHIWACFVKLQDRTGLYFYTVQYNSNRVKNEAIFKYQPKAICTYLPS